VEEESDLPSGSRPVRERILRAAMDAFMELGYAEASTLKIATRAQVSKRELYAFFGTKQAMLAACIADRVGRMRLPSPLPMPRNRDELATMLAKLGTIVLREVSHPGVIAVFRLAIMEAQRAPDVAATLEAARQSVRDVIGRVTEQARSVGLIDKHAPHDMEVRFLALLWDDLMVSMLLRVREAPRGAEINRRAKRAAEDFLRLYAQP
jgi:AcrR family transcriptional regulator